MPLEYITAMQNWITQQTLFYSMKEAALQQTPLIHVHLDIRSYKAKQNRSQNVTHDLVFDSFKVNFIPRIIHFHTKQQWHTNAPYQIPQVAKTKRENWLTCNKMHRFIHNEQKWCHFLHF